MTQNSSTCAVHSQPTESQAAPVFTPRVDLYEDPSGLVLYVDLPGVQPGSIELHYHAGELTLLGKVPPRTLGQRRLVEEYAVGDYRRSFKLHESIDGGRISAAYKNGVLKVILPKVETARPRQIVVHPN